MIKLFTYLEKNYNWSNTYGLARSILSLGTLLTLLGNSTDILFKSAISNSSSCDFLGISLYCIIGDLEISRWASIVLLIPVVIGWRPMVTGLIHWWVTYSLVNSATIIDGGDHIASIISVLLVPITLTDTRKWHWSVSENPPSHWFPIRALISFSCFLVIKIQISIIYLNSAAAKLFVREWMDGTAIYYWFKHPVFGYSEWLGYFLEPLILNGTTLFIITWGTIIFEFILFAGLFMDKRFKRWLFISGIGFHFGIFIIHGLASFFITMLSCLILYLFSPKQNFTYSKSVLNLKNKFL